jgi:hypothetical protein
MSRFFATLSVLFASQLCPLTAQVQPANSKAQGDQSAVLQVPVQATVQVEPGAGISDNNRPPTGDVFYETPPLFAGHFVGGAGAYLIKPFFQNNPAFSTKVVQYTEWSPPVSVMMPSFWVPSSVIRQEHDFCWDLNAAPLVWLGYVTDSGLGVRARWWRFDQSVQTCVINDGSTTITSASPRGIEIVSEPHINEVVPFWAMANTLEKGSALVGEKMGLASNLKLDVWDFEATQEAEAGRWRFLFSGGARYAHLSQNYNANLVSQNVGADIEALRSGHNFSGAGPTLALEARRPLGNTGFAVYGNIRGSLLFGEAEQRVYLLTTSPGLFGPNSYASLFRANRDTFLPVGEMELGAEYSRIFGWIHPFIRTGLVAQSWFGAGSASSDGGNLGFLGLEVSAGLNY